MSLDRRKGRARLMPEMNDFDLAGGKRSPKRRDSPAGNAESMAHAKSLQSVNDGLADRLRGSTRSPGHLVQRSSRHPQSIPSRWAYPQAIAEIIDEKLLILFAIRRSAALQVVRAPGTPERDRAESFDSVVSP